MSRREELARMSFGEHLEELRRRLFRSLLALLASTSLAFAFHDALFRLAMLPHWRAHALFDPPPPDWKLFSGDFVDPVKSLVKLSLLTGFFLASPVIGWQAWSFVRSALYPHERRWALSFGVCSFLLFVAGGVSGYFVLIPYTLYGMASMLPMETVQPAFVVGPYLDLVMTLTLALGAVFQLPLLMAFLTRVGLVEPRAWGRWRKHGLVGNLVLAAVLAPGDPVSLFAFAAPLLVLYEVGVLAARLCAPRPAVAPAPA